MLRLGEIRNAKGAHREVKRLGRGAGSGRGGTAGKGHKGQLARSGGQSRRGFEGGQMPLYRRLPKRGFTNLFRTKYAVLNLRDLEQFGLNEVSIDSLKQAGLLKTSRKHLKILGTGQLTKAIRIKAHAFSASAEEKIKQAGGTIEVIA